MYSFYEDNQTDSITKFVTKYIYKSRSTGHLVTSYIQTPEYMILIIFHTFRLLALFSQYL